MPRNTWDNVLIENVQMTTCKEQTYRNAIVWLNFYAAKKSLHNKMNHRLEQISDKTKI